jgi:hypothetical protein
LKRGTLALPAAWPGWSDAGSLVIPVPLSAWRPPESAITVDGGAFAPKHELHVTVIGKTLGAAVRARIDGPELRDAFGSQRWRLRRSGWRVRLRKAGDDGDFKESIVEPVALPAMARVHAWLGERLGCTLPVPPPHVTLYVRGDPEGIGVPDAESCRRLRVGAPWRADD